MTWQSHAEHSVIWSSPSCAKVAMMAGKGKAAVAEKQSQICKVAHYNIAWLQKGKSRQGGRKRFACGHRVTNPSLGRHIVCIPAPVWAQHSPAKGRRLAEAGRASRRDLAPAADAEALWTGLPPGQLQPEHRCVLLLTWTATLLVAVSSF